MKYFMATHGSLIYVVDGKQYKSFAYKRGPKGKWHKYMNAEYLMYGIGNFSDPTMYVEILTLPKELQ